MNGTDMVKRRRDVLVSNDISAISNGKYLFRVIALAHLEAHVNAA